MAFNDEFKITKLNSENYHAWSIRTKAALVQKNCWEAVDPGYSGSEMTDEERKHNNKALTFLFLVVEDSHLDDIGTCTTAKEAWEILREIHTKYGLLHVLQLLRDFVNVQKKDDEPMKEYLSRLMDLHRKLTNGGYGFTDKEVALVMLMGLPESYGALILKLEQDEATLTAKEVKARLLVEEKRKKRRDEGQTTKSDGTARALFTKREAESQYKSVGDNMSEGKSSSRGRGMKSFQNVRHDVGRRRVRCFACGKLGHIAKHCEEVDDDTTPQKSTGRRQAKKVTHASLSVSDTRYGSHAVWYMDSGATDHMTSNRTKFVEFQPYESTVHTANQDIMKVLGLGEVKFQLKEEYGGNFLTLKNVLYVPELDGNILSVGKIEELNFKVTFHNGKAEVRRSNGETILSATRSGRLYTVEELCSSSRLSKRGCTVDVSLWHRRLGHLHLDAVYQLCPESFRSDEGRCSTCVEGKLRRNSFPSSDVSVRATAPLELIHSDVGSVTPTSKGGSKYFVTFIDDYSRYAVVYPMKRKNEVLKKFDEYRRMVENLHSTTIKTLRSDNGGEYVGDDFKQYLTKYGITRQLTVPGTPQQNGIAERYNQTLMDMTRCLLIESGLTKTLWADALDTAAHIRNKCPSKAVNHQVPETLWLNREAKIDYLRVYGCRAWAVQRRQRRKTKLDPKAVECILVGYPEGVKGYKLWDMKNDEFFLSRDVVFDEGVFPCKSETVETVTEPVTAESCNDDGIVVINLEVNDEDEAPKETPIREPEQQEVACQCANRDEELVDEAGQVEDEVEQLPRRSQRLANKPRPNYCYTVTQADAIPDPITLEEALSMPDGNYWQEAIDEELGNLERNGTWEIVPRPRDQGVVKCKWIFRKKYDENGNLQRYKARLVACGYSQVQGIDFNETYSPVIKMKSIRILLAVAIERDWKIHQVDITAAYLNGIVKETIYMEQPTILCKEDQDNVCLLKKSLYGLRQSGREWNIRLDELLKNEGMTRSKADPCVYFCEDLIIGVYVDDILILAKTERKIEDFKQKLRSAFEVKDLGEASHILSMRIRRNEDGSLILDQTKYAEELVETFGMKDARGASSPLDPGMKYKKARDDDEAANALSHLYRQAIGGLLYLAGGTRPDLAFAASYMSQFNVKPTEQHWSGLKHMLRYLKQTKDVALTFSKTGKQIQAFCDADWATDCVDRRSFSGYVFTLAGAAVSWSSKKQTSTALSTVEAEYIAMCHATKEVLWLQHFTKEVGASEFIGEPHTLFVDNQGAIAVGNNQVVSERNKHIELRHFFLREKIETGQLKLQYIRTSENYADIMTKALNGNRTRRHCESLGLHKHQTPIPSTKVFATTH